MSSVAWQVKNFLKIQISINICDAIWENGSDVVKWHLEKWLQTV